VKDLRWWSSLTMAEIREGLAMVGSRLGHEVVDGVAYWFATAGPAQVSGPCLRAASPSVHLLQAYDEYFVGYGPDRELLDLAGVTKALPEGEGAFNHVIVLDGKVAGSWKRRIKRTSVEVEAVLSTPFDAAQRAALQVAADEHAAFLGLLATEVVTTAR
jgi:Winged helix DNA-binding domain